MHLLPWEGYLRLALAAYSVAATSFVGGWRFKEASNPMKWQHALLFIVSIAAWIAAVVLTGFALWAGGVPAILSGWLHGIPRAASGALLWVAATLACFVPILWAYRRWSALTVRVEVRPVSGANPQALLEIVNRGDGAGEFYASARVLGIVGERAEYFRDLTLRPPWLAPEVSDVIHLEGGQAGGLLLATSSTEEWKIDGLAIPKGIERLRVKLEDAGGHGETFQSLGDESIRIHMRVTVNRKKTRGEVRQPRSLVRDFWIIGHPSWDLAISSDPHFSFEATTAAPPYSAGSE